MRLNTETKNELNNPIYERKTTEQATSALDRLKIDNPEIRSFYEIYEGPFWSEHTGHELLDVIEGENTIETATLACRDHHHFPQHLIALTELSSAGQIVVINLLNEDVYEIDFEGSHIELINDTPLPRWNNFIEFLNFYFSGKI